MAGPNPRFVTRYRIAVKSDESARRDRAVNQSQCVGAFSVKNLAVLLLFAVAWIGCRRPAASDQPVEPLAEPVAVSPTDSVNRSAASAEQNLTATDPTWSHEGLDAVAWVQTSAEYAVIARQVYQMASMHLQKALDDPQWTALPDQASQLDHDSSLMPAVILDLDETVLDNSGFQAECVLGDRNFTPKAWRTWVLQEKARLVPGAKSFLELCRAADVAVLFVTNRKSDVESSTKSNLQKLGVIPAGDDDSIFSKGEQAGWGSDKTSRRDHLAKKYRILMMVGDDLNDFVFAGRNVNDQQRRDASQKYQDYWGTKWFLLPNPCYGGWERSLYEYDNDIQRDGRLKAKRQSLWTSDTEEH